MKDLIPLFIMTCLELQFKHHYTQEYIVLTLYYHSMTKVYSIKDSVEGSHREMLNSHKKRI